MGDVTAVMMDCITEKSGHSVTPMAVSVCLTPAAPAPLPIPYPVVASSIEGIGDAPMRTKINGALIGTVGSVLKTCHGNEPGTLKEVVSLNTAGPCFIIMGAPVVLCELGMMGITGSMCMQNKAPTPGAGGSASDAGGTGGAGGGGGEGSGSGGDGHGPGGPAGGGGAGGGGSNSGAAGPGSSSAAPAEHQCQGGHPVDLATGYVVDQQIDIELPGRIPLLFQRFYSSSRRRDTTATLGPGWAHGFEQQITEGEHVVTLREAEGREVRFARIAVGESTFHRRERMTLHRDGPSSWRVERSRDRRTLVFTAARQGSPARLRSIRDAWDNAVTLDHHDDGERLSRITDTAGRELTFTWKESRIVRLEVRAEGRLEQWVDYAYSASGCLTSVIDALGGTEEYEYDRWNRMTAATIKTGVRFQYEYEANTGRCKKTWGPKGLYALELRADKATKTTHVDSADEPRVITWNDEGFATREALPDGTILVERAYDEGHLIAVVNGAGEGEQYWYDERGNQIRHVDATGATTTTDHDARDRPIRKTGPDGLVTTCGYGARGALTHIAHPSGDAFDYSFDERGRLTEIHGPEGKIRVFEYDAQHNRVAETDARGARTTFTFDSLGRITSRTDALGRTTRALHDRLGRRGTLRLPDGGTVQRAHDARGNVVRETDPLGRTITMEYGGMGVLTQLTCADGRQWKFAYTGQERLCQIKNPRGEVQSYVHDEAGRVVEETTFDGRVLAYAHEAGGRLARIGYGDASFRAFSYDRGGRLVGEDGSDRSHLAYQRDALGRLVGVVIEEPGGAPIVTLFERDRLGRVVAERHGDRAIRHGYDVRGRRVERVLPDGATTRFAWDAENALLAVDHAGHTLTFERDAIGREIGRSTGGGHVTIRSTYDAMDRLIDQRVSAPSAQDGVPAALVQRRWGYDRSGRVLRVDDARWGTTTYAHDRSDRLVEATRGDHREAFTYDAAGSLVAALEGLGAAKGTWEIAPGNVLKRTASAKYTYDARGRRTVKLELGGQGLVTEYAWDVRDRLREVKLPGGARMVLTYDGLGRRVRKEVLPAGTGTAPHTVEYLWDLNELAVELDSARGGARAFVHKPGTFLPLLQIERGEVFTYVNDPLGTPRELIDASGKIAWSATSTAWGRVLETRADPPSEQARRRSIDTPFRLLGQLADEETGLCWTRFRCFDPEVGRWLSPDPLGVEGGMDLFGFNGSPLLIVDPLGLTGDPHPPQQPRPSPAPTDDPYHPDNVAARSAQNQALYGPRPSGPNQMQSQVNRDQAPASVDRVDGPHVPGQQPHVHYLDGTSSNRDGTTHDALGGTPAPNRETQSWLRGHGWTPPP